MLVVGRQQQGKSPEVIAATILPEEAKVRVLLKVEGVKKAQYWLSIVLKKEIPAELSAGISVW